MADVPCASIRPSRRSVASRKRWTLRILVPLFLLSLLSGPSAQRQRISAIAIAEAQGEPGKREGKSIPEPAELVSAKPPRLSPRKSDWKKRDPIDPLTQIEPRLRDANDPWSIAADVGTNVLICDTYDVDYLKARQFVAETLLREIGRQARNQSCRADARVHSRLPSGTGRPCRGDGLERSSIHCRGCRQPFCSGNVPRTRRRSPTVMEVPNSRSIRCKLVLGGTKSSKVWRRNTGKS